MPALENIANDALVVVEGEAWSISLKAWEYREWDRYAETHPWLFYGVSSSYVLLTMFLSHLRMGVNLNEQYELLSPRRPSKEQLA